MGKLTRVYTPIFNNVYLFHTKSFSLSHLPLQTNDRWMSWFWHGYYQRKEQFETDIVFTDVKYGALSIWKQKFFNAIDLLLLCSFLYWKEKTTRLLYGEGLLTFFSLKFIRMCGDETTEKYSIRMDSILIRYPYRWICDVQSWAHIKYSWRVH